MIRQILRKDVLENVLSLRFLLSLILTLLLFAVSGFVFVSRYEKQSQDYWNRTNKNLSALREASSGLHRLAFYRQNVYRRPKSLTFCVEGFDKSLPNRFGSMPSRVIYRKLKPAAILFFLTSVTSTGFSSSPRS